MAEPSEKEIQITAEDNDDSHDYHSPATHPQRHVWARHVKNLLETKITFLDKTGLGGGQDTNEIAAIKDLCDWLCREQGRDGREQVRDALRPLSVLASSPSRHCRVPAIVMRSAEVGDPACHYIVTEYGGLQFNTAKSLVTKLKVATEAITFVRAMNMSIVRKGETEKDPPGLFFPPEWGMLKPEAKRKLAKMLSLESLGKWSSFNMFDVAEACGGKPLLFVGWAILASPFAQTSMAHDPDVRGDGSASDSDDEYEFDTGYNFTAAFAVHPRIICNFLRSIESDYKPKSEVPYHNSTHAADVMQATHCFLSMGAAGYSSSPVEKFSLLVAAAVHDVGHPGTNNAYQICKRTDAALTYNDQSVLENMHVSLALRRLFKEDHDADIDILSGMKDQEVKNARDIIIVAVLETDFTRHFELHTAMADRVKDMKKVAANTKGGDDSTHDLWRKIEHGEPAKQALRYVLKVADIASQARPSAIAEEWSQRVYREFFAQGDAEKEAGLCVSPLCDRETTVREESQIGFLQYVVKPAVELLSTMVPKIGGELLPIVDDNINYWKDQTAALKEASGAAGGDER